MKSLLLLCVALAIATASFADSTVNGGTHSLRTPEQRWHGNTPVHILLIQDQDGWGLPVHVAILNASGIAYDVINSATIAATNFFAYDKIITAGQQPDDFYFAIQANSAKFTEYMAAGGCVAFEIANYYGGANEQITWPGGFTATIVSCQNVASLDDVESCLAQNVDVGTLQNWGCSVHGTIGNPPAGYSNILSSPDGTATGSFPLGLGGGFISHQPLEVGYVYSPQYTTNFDLCNCPNEPDAVGPMSWGRLKVMYR